ncbi:hypothetical protein, partial [Enterococcus hailinensis]|uniref:hypothetical protein n=1 Tax=Enterococcus hailinensis TaxID=3238988 RepID=UPI0038B24170
INTPRYTLYYITSYKSTKKPLYIKRYSGFSSDYRYTIRECRLKRSKKKSFDWYKKVIATNGEDLTTA